MTRRINEATERVSGGGMELPDATLIDFWRWAFSDLCDDDVKGIFAEWLVARLIGISHVRRVSWANSDLITPEGVRIEVKASAYWQSWKLVGEDGLPLEQPRRPACKESDVRFGGLRARNALEPVQSKDLSASKSDIYVFAFQNELNPERWNAMDLSQWEFYLCRREVLATFAGDSVSLVRLRRSLPRLSATEFAPAVRVAIQEVAAARGPVANSEC